ncbi:MAG: hypothetical protein JWN80_3153, partial [Microbacteriaceae bacterium]|nr:hypothetical protein [Microbacteriaceae bacterium]
MKAAPFEYARAQSLDHAVQMLAEHGDEGKVIAGGQSLVPMLRKALRWVGHTPTRNRGTIGGSLAHADPSA